MKTSPYMVDDKTPSNEIWCGKIKWNLLYNLGDNETQKCSQKFSNDQKCYLNYVKHQK